MKELEQHVLRCVKDQNGNHVVQKAIERVPAEHIQFIINAFTGQVQSLATHPYGCRVIQRMLEHCTEPARTSVLQELHACASSLIVDQYGNYVTQHVIEHGREGDRARIISLVTLQLLTFSKHKFASNVVEKSIQFGSDQQRQMIVATLTALNDKGESPLQSLMRDQYGNYVIRKSCSRASTVHNKVLKRRSRKTPRPAHRLRVRRICRKHQTATSSPQEIFLRQANRRHREGHLQQPDPSPTRSPRLTPALCRAYPAASHQRRSIPPEQLLAQHQQQHRRRPRRRPQSQTRRHSRSQRRLPDLIPTAPTTPKRIPPLLNQSLHISSRPNIGPGNFGSNLAQKEKRKSPFSSHHVVFGRLKKIFLIIGANRAGASPWGVVGKVLVGGGEGGGGRN